MFDKLPYFSLVLILFILCSTPDIAKGITVFEYGVHIDGAESTFAMNGMIPPMTQIYTVNATPTRPGFENKLSYVKVEYNSPMSHVDIDFNPSTSVLVFYIRFPFVDIPFGIVGYSIRAKPKTKLRSRKKCWCRRNVKNAIIKTFAQC